MPSSYTLLDALLAYILNDLQPQQAERREAPSTKERIRLVLQAIGEATKRLVILVDDAQVLLEQNGELSLGWQHFLGEVIEHSHQATFVDEPLSPPVGPLGQKA